MKLGVFLATFHRTDVLRLSIQNLFEQSHPPDILLVVDNASDPETEESIKERNDPRISYLAMGKNLGSAGGAAVGVQWLLEQGCDYIYLGDDDDPPLTQDTIERVMKIVTGNSEIVGGAAVGAKWNWETGEPVRFADEELTGVIDVDVVGGNNHLILDRRIVEKVGIPNAELFFGNWDYEYCLRIRRANYRILVDGELMTRYRKRNRRLNLKRPVLSKRQKSALWRDYYVTRNSIFMMRSTFARKDVARRRAFKSLIKTLGAWRNGPGYGMRYFWLQLRGIIDGYFGRLGRTITPIPGTQKTITTFQ